MKKIFTVLAAVMTLCGLSAENYFLKSTWGQAEATWKQMIDDDGSFIFDGDVFFDGNDIAINTVASDEGARIIKVENIDAMLNYEKAELAAGDSVFFVYVPDMYNQYNEKESGLMAMINWKNGYAIKYDAAWKNMAKDDETFVLFNAAYAGKDVQLANGKNIRAIKAENINSMLNYDAAELAAGDSVMYVYDPEAYSQYDEKASGLIAMITWKNGYAILENGAWKNMIEDDGTFSTYATVAVDGKNVQVVKGNNIQSIEMKNIQALLNYDEAELAAGDSVMYVYDPEGYSAYDETKSGLIAIINWKNGYAIKYDAAWKNMAKDDETFVLFNAAYAGKPVQIVTGNQIRAIKAENINTMLNYDAAELAAGDSVMYVYDPEAYSQYDEKASGLIAMITWKNGYAILENGAWKNMIDDDPEDHDWWIFEKIEFNGKAVQIVTENQIRAIEPKNIEAYINYDAAELSVGDTVMYVYRPSLYNRYDETQSGMYAHILVKNGYAMLGTWGEQSASWKNMILDAAQEDETYVLDSVIFDGNDVQFVSNEGIRVIKVANIPALLMEDYSEATLEEGDLVMFVYTPDTYSHYDETKSGLMALIYEKSQEQGIESIAVEGKAVKVIMNGQMMIIKNGQMYNATGVLVK